MIRSLLALVCTLFLMGGVLFVPAGTVAWVRGWTFCLAFTGAVLIAIVVLWRVNREIFSARSRVQPGTKRLDVVFIAITLMAFLAIFPTSALDYRHQLAQTPDWVSWAGYVPFFLGFAGTTWAQAVNRFFEPGIRIQSDRGQTVVSTGPYAVVRHPGYISGAVMAVSIPLCLGSWWGLLPASIFVIGLIPRTLFEEYVLTNGLAGYDAYKQRVRYRWIPGIW